MSADGIADAIAHGMPKPGDVATSYEEITDNTVPAFDMFGTTAPERELEARVRAALQADPRLAQTQIDAIVHGSGVWLSGTASPGTVAHAVDTARKVEGVTEVHVVEPGL